MRPSRKLALLLAPDLRDVARRINEVEKGLEVAQGLLDRIVVTEERVTWSAIEESRDAIVESRARLLEVEAELTGRRHPHALRSRRPGGSPNPG